MNSRPASVVVPAEAVIRVSVEEDVTMSPVNVLFPMLIRAPLPIVLLPRPARESSRAKVCPTPLTAPPCSIRLPDSKPVVLEPKTAIVPVLVPSCDGEVIANTPPLMEVIPE